MHYLTFLAGIHNALRPDNYLEIGVRSGASLARSRVQSIGVDPAFLVKSEIACEVALVRASSDDFFARPHPLKRLVGKPVGYAFINGTHLLEHALRDFINVEKHADWTTAIVLNQALPHSNEEAARDRHARPKTGDVYKMISVLERYRPDLVLLRIDTRPTGVLLVLGADPTSTVLSDSYEQIFTEFVTPDPQVVPADILERRGVLAPEEVLSASFWRLLRQQRHKGTGRAAGLPLLRTAMENPSSVPAALAGMDRVTGTLRRRTKQVVRALR